MKGKIVMKCRPAGNKLKTRTLVCLKDVSDDKKMRLLKSFLKALEIPAPVAVGYLIDIAGGAALTETMVDARDATEVTGDD